MRVINVGMVMRSLVLSIWLVMIHTLNFPSALFELTSKSYFLTKEFQLEMFGKLFVAERAAYPWQSDGVITL